MSSRKSKYCVYRRNIVLCLLESHNSICIPSWSFLLSCGEPRHYMYTAVLVSCVFWGAKALYAHRSVVTVPHVLWGTKVLHLMCTVMIVSCVLWGTKVLYTSIPYVDRCNRVSHLLGTHGTVCTPSWSFLVPCGEPRYHSILYLDRHDRFLCLAGK